VAIHAGATDDRALGNGVLIERESVLTSLSVAGGASGLWVTFPQAGSVVRHPVSRVRTSGGLAVLELAAPAPRSARPAPLRRAEGASLVGERWQAAGGSAYGVIGAALAGGRVRLETSSPAGLTAASTGAGVWSPRLGAVVGVIERGSAAWTLPEAIASSAGRGAFQGRASVQYGAPSAGDAASSGASSSDASSSDASSSGGASLSGASSAGGVPRAVGGALGPARGGGRGTDDVPERTPMIRQNGDAGPAARSWSLETSAEPGRLWRPAADGGPVESDHGEPARRPPGRETARRRKAARTRRRAEQPYQTAWMAGARRPERVPSAGGAVALLCQVTIGSRVLVASAAADGTVALADPASGQAWRTLRTEPGQVRALVPLVLPDATCLGIVTADGSLTAWAPEQGWGQTFTVHGGRATTATCGNVGMLAVGGEDGTVEVRALGDGRPRWTATAGGGPVAALCALPGLIAAAGADGQIRLRDVESGELRRTLDPSGGPLRAICPVPIGDRTLLAAAGDNGLVLLWDPETGEPRHELTGHSGPVTALCPVPTGDGKTTVLASAGTDRTARLWEPDSGECRMTVPLHHEATACVAAGGHLIVGLAAGTVAYSFDL
jgi:hypothetical protein